MSHHQHNWPMILTGLKSEPAVKTCTFGQSNQVLTVLGQTTWARQQQGKYLNWQQQTRWDEGMTDILCTWLYMKVLGLVNYSMSTVWIKVYLYTTHLTVKMYGRFISRWQIPNWAFLELVPFIMVIIPLVTSVQPKTNFRSKFNTSVAQLMAYMVCTQSLRW